MKSPLVPSESIKVRQATTGDVAGILAVAAAAYAAWPARVLATERHYQLQQAAFPEGQLVAVAGSLVVGYSTSLIVQMVEDSPWYDHGEITGAGTFSTHDAGGNTLYGADLAVHPEWQRRGVSKRLYAARKALLRRLNLKEMMAGGRIPGFATSAVRLTAKEYVAKVVAGELTDPSLNAHLAAGYEVRGVHYGYISDEQSLGFATHLVFPNQRHRPTKRMLAAQPIRRSARRARVCAVQYEMRRIKDWDEFCEQVEYFIDTADAYDCHLLVLPELFTAQLLCTMPRGESVPELCRRLTEYHGRYCDFFRQQAMRTDLLIVAGSTPVAQADGSIRNVAHLFSPGGNVYTQDKLHLTPAEAENWGISPGEGLRVFDTSFGRMAILTCYDIEFPELSRIVVDAGVDLLVCPFATDERKAYQRVRSCAQARAVENTVYVVLAGNVGSLPRSPAFAVNFGQAAVLTPSDFAFPLYAIAAEGVVNTQTVVITDIDLGALEVEREVANVRPLLDRRSDLYHLQARVVVDHVKVS